MTAFFKWKPAYDLGVTAMNDEHKVLITIMEKLYQQHEAKATFNTLRATINELQDYTVKHFDDEEKFMDSINYPDLKVHKIIHADLLKKFAKHKENFLDSKEIEGSFFNFLQLWLSAHIQGIDMKYADHSKTAPNVA